MKTNHAMGEAGRIELRDVRETAGHVFEHLQPNRAYSSAMIVDFAVVEGLLKGNGLPLARRRAQLWAVLDLFARVHGFPVWGDRQVLLSDLKPEPGWYGSRWLKAYRKSQPQQAGQLKQRGRPGRPKLYQETVLLLNDETCYSAAAVAAFAVVHVYAHLPDWRQLKLPPNDN